MATNIMNGYVSADGHVVEPADLADQSYGDPEFTPLWETLKEIGLPVSIHSGTTTGEPFAIKFERIGMGMGIVNTKITLPMNALAGLIWGAIPQRYPKLKFVIVEGGIGWIASLLGLMDHRWKDHYRWMEPKLNELPSHYFKRQFWATFEDDWAEILTRELLGVDRLMWGSDYPHTEGTFPHSQEQIVKDFWGVPEDEVYRMVVGNAAGLYGLDT
jgi:predicted TIM-barrel fold metal-dependent hydrolase